MECFEIITRLTLDHLWILNWNQSSLVAGDEHLAVFRVSKLDNAEATSNPGPSEDKVDTAIPEDVETVATERTKTI